MTCGTNNPFLPNHATMIISKFPDIEFMVTGFSIPPITLNPVSQPTALLELHRPSDMADYGSFSLTFNIDEKFKNYLAIYNWIRALASPTDRDKYIGYGAEEADIAILIYDANYAQIGKVSLHHAFPINLPEVPINFEETSGDPRSVGVDFAYSWFDLTID